ncbi:GntR family transcriptional regulator [Streptomyces sp. H27-C3]|uniref:GntR family transcriptional regulator n=1 Tax=Streptomyces sp. H27-C3 TaxID=3046305 RepID=UPI0024B8A467|nr:GntR family transcriptional regulator [Streptomyces sp. H27-C3]MDJ0464968.1 GntR family transcriptional regulator [Streptomyces sp. H27-C3]
MARRTTAYRRVADTLRGQIDDGLLKPGDRIGSLSELQEQFGVSDTVILEARKVLVAEGLLQARSGDGTYVRERPAPKRLVHHEPDEPGQPLFRLETGESGLFPDAIEVEAETDVPASAAVARHLGVRAGRKVRRSVRLFRQDGAPVQLVTVHALAGGKRSEATGVEEEITSRPAMDAEARALEGVAGQLVTAMLRVERPAAGPARVLETVVLAERYTLVYRPVAVPA